MRTPPLDSRIWANDASGREFRSYTCLDCGRRFAAWDRFLAHRIAVRRRDPFDYPLPSICRDNNGNAAVAAIARLVADVDAQEDAA